MIKATNLVKAEKIAGSDNKKLRIVLKGGTVLVGQSWGIEPSDDDNPESSEDVLAFMCDDLDRVFWLKDGEIKDVTLATEEA